MPEKPLTIATYAAGASLAAITLVYVFGPTFFLDDEAAHSSRSSRKKGVVGLNNPANDCFINSVLQTLAGLPDLRAYLIREMHRRKLDGAEIYDDLTGASLDRTAYGRSNKEKMPEWKLLGLQQGLVTAALKDVLDALNERPIYKKTISAGAFVRVLEHVFRTRISRQQQDAQEFLQIVTERLADEHFAGRKARRRATRNLGSAGDSETTNNAGLEVPERDQNLEDSEETIKPKKPHAPNTEITPETSDGRRNAKISGNTVGSLVDSGVDTSSTKEQEDDAEDERSDVLPFPFEGKMESQIECQYCHFKPKPAISSFVTLTLNVPQQHNSTSLAACFDGMLRIEHIDDFKCDRCRLQHALNVKTTKASRASTQQAEWSKLQDDIRKIQNALETDPEEAPKGVELPPIAQAPKRKIDRHMRISSFPRILAIHLSRSVWDAQSISTKNLAKVSFPEALPLGGLLDRKTYRLLGVVTHKGGHNSGHYESFRRQVLSPPYSTPMSFGTEGIYSVHNSPKPSVAPSPALTAQTSKDAVSESTTPTTPETHALSSSSLPSPSSSSASSHSNPSSLLDRRKVRPTSVPLDAIPTPGLPPPPRELPPMQAPQPPQRQRGSTADLTRFKRRQRKSDRWWRISDEKVKESKTSDVLGMQREVYLLFYEMVDEALP